MNKVVNINLNGYVFTVNEDAYEMLKAYLDRLSSHFNGKEGAMEIIADIETRIAELVLQRTGNPATVVDIDVIRQVIAMLGEPWQMDEEEQNTGNRESAGEPAAPEQPRKLQRDPDNRVIAGVCSGVANYLGLDAVLVRLLFTVSLFVFGVAIPLYIIFWIAMPKAKPGAVKSAVPENSRKLFRDPDNRLLGGVCGGLGNYFGIDPVWFKVAFIVLTLFYGSSILLYIILWIAIPKAQSTADRLRMKGQPVDISNIERMVNNTMPGAGNKLSRAGGFLTEVFTLLVNLFGRIFGFIWLMIGLGMLVCAMIGLFFSSQFNSISVAEFFIGSPLVHHIAYVGGVLFFIPIGLLLTLGGMKMLFRMKYRSKGLFVTLTVLSIAGFLTIGTSALMYAYSIHEENSVVINQSMNQVPDTVYLKVHPVAGHTSSRLAFGHRENHMVFGKEGSDSLFLSNQEIYLVPSEDQGGSVEQFNTARGETRQEAKEHAGIIDYRVSIDDSVIWFDEGMVFPLNGQFYHQEVKINVKLPVGTIIKVDEPVARMIANDYEFHAYRDRRHRRHRHLVVNTLYRVTEDGVVSLEKGRVTIDQDRDDESVNIHIDTDDEDDGDVEIHIEKDGDGNVKVEKHETKSEDGKTIRVEEHKAGPVRVKKTEVVDEQ